MHSLGNSLFEAIRPGFSSALGLIAWLPAPIMAVTAMKNGPNEQPILPPPPINSRKQSPIGLNELVEQTGAEVVFRPW